MCDYRACVLCSDCSMFVIGVMCWSCCEDHLLARPTHEEVEHSLWQLVFEARRKVDNLKKEPRDKNDRWRKEEKNIRE